MEYCKDTNVPECDNTPLDCPIYVKDKCVTVTEGNAFLLTNDNEALEDFHIKLIEKLIAFNQSITVLENSNPIGAVYSFTLTGTSLNLLLNGDIQATIDLQSITTGGVSERKEIFTGTVGQTSVTLISTPLINTVNQVIVEGVTFLEGIGNDYTIAGNIVTFSTPMSAGDLIQVIYKY